MDKIIITAAICGAEVNREQTPHVPINAEELGNEASRCLDAGAAIIHLHVRKEDSAPTQKLKYFKRAFTAIKESCQVLPIIQPSTGGAAGMKFKERAEPIQMIPEMATLDCGSINFGNEIFINDLPMMRDFAKMMHTENILPELECFEPGHIHNSLLLCDEGLLTGHLHYNLVLGVPGALNGSARSLFMMSDTVPGDATWTVSGIGRHELPLSFVALGMGGHVRVGLEDNIFYKKGELAKGSAQLVERISRIARELGREPATPDEARKILGIPLNQKDKIKFPSAGRLGRRRIP